MACTSARTDDGEGEMFGEAEGIWVREGDSELGRRARVVGGLWVL
jgi:hypothetical protein